MEGDHSLSLNSFIRCTANTIRDSKWLMANSFKKEGSTDRVYSGFYGLKKSTDTNSVHV